MEDLPLDYEDFSPDASKLLDEAIFWEHHHREQLLFWKQIRMRLEKLIPDPIQEAIDIAENAWGKQ